MAVIRALICVGFVAFFSYSASAQQCDQAIEDFHQCLRDSVKPQRGKGQGQRPNLGDLKQKAEECFTSNNCEAPKGGPRGGPRGGASGGPNGQGSQGSDNGQSGPGGRGGQGGRAGRFGQGGGASGGSDDRRKCFQAVGNKTKDYMVQCVRKSDPTFNPQKGGPGGHGGFGGGPGGPGGPRGPGGPGGPGGFHGGPGGPGGHPGGPGGQQFLLDACKNNADAAAKVNSCLAGLFPKPDTTQMRQQFEEHCKAKSACEAKLGTCKDTMEKRRQAMCTCGQEVRSKRQEFMQAEPACANVQQPQGSNGSKRPGQGKQRDCSQKPQDPCQGGFDAFMKQAEAHRRPGN